ncbi:MAG: nicotinate phosphoribosyltransferase [Candidatus Heimdallarchaeota archaeon]|nr:MAG: nicotinate phosphoribosyltransferase [Candidatus Heimdallarchaeota archaeon]
MFYRKNRALFTDLYQLTMCQGYFDLDFTRKQATFDLFFRSNPFKGGYTIACGIPLALEFLTNLKFTERDLNYLREQKIFSEEFLEYLLKLRFTGKVEGVREGSVIFPYTPIISVTGPIIETQLVETALLNIINYSTLIATKAARIVNTARGGIIIEFGLRRAQGDSAYIGVRAALVGGCMGTSFIHGGQIWNCPIVGTQAHSWVQAFDSELESFKSYAEIFPDKCLLLIDTYDVLKSGLPHAIEVAKMLRKRGKEILGVRIDSGDLAYLSVEVYREFKKAGFPNISIVLSNELDEFTINSIVQQILERGINNQEERELHEEVISRLSYGVGTKLITGGQQSALGGVYKLVALNKIPKIKVSENVTKTINPGIKKVWRIIDDNEKFIADVIGLYDENDPCSGDWIYHPIEYLKKYQLPKHIVIEPLHHLLMKNGKIIIDEDLYDWKLSQQFCKEQLNGLDSTYKRLLNPHIYKVSLTNQLYELKIDLIKEFSP